MIIQTADRIRELREAKLLTQSDLARKLSVTRSSVNAWEMGISTPSIENIIELAKTFHVSTDYILGLDNQTMINISNLNVDEKEIIHRLMLYFDSIKKKS
jgi:transcriptional regulator with XRE-family HTH domain